MSAALVTFSVDSDLLKSYLPQVTLAGTGDVWTSARVTAQINAAAARVNGVLIAAGEDPAAINADTSSALYALVRHWICILVIPRIAFGLGGLGVDMEDTLRDMRAEAADLNARFAVRPEELGSDTAERSPGVVSNLPTAETDADGTYIPTRSYQSTVAYPYRW